jgi:very-short-patch-repair endonuclease
MKEYKDNLFYGAKPDIFKKASTLKHEMTNAEKFLWKYLRNRKLNGLKFRRQHPLDIFIADFYCHEKKLIIEVDGGIHDDMDQKEYDEGRSYELNEKGYKILRFKNDEILNNIENVVQSIIQFSQTIQ